jgi:hypothetical protein
VIVRRDVHPRKQDSVLCHHFSNAPTRPSSPCSPATVYLACTLPGPDDTGPKAFSPWLSSGVLTFLQGGRPPQRWLGMPTPPSSLCCIKEQGPGVTPVTPGPCMLARNSRVSQDFAAGTGNALAGLPAGADALEVAAKGSHGILMYASARRV